MLMRLGANGESRVAGHDLILGRRNKVPCRSSVRITSGYRRFSVRQRQLSEKKGPPYARATARRSGQNAYSLETVLER